MLSECFRICFTGGPCGGKSTAITEISTYFKKQGVPVVQVPEVASLIYGAGASLDLSTYSEQEAINFQACILNLQMGLESMLQKIGILTQMNKDMKHKKLFILCDRGLQDGSAYLTSEQWEQVLKCNNLIMVHDSKIFSRYDVILHMVTAADGAEEYYQT